MNVRYLVFPRVRAIEYRAHAGAYVVGVPQPTAIAGLTHALARKLAGAKGQPVRAQTPFVYAVSEFRGLAGVSRNPASGFDTEKPKRKTPGPIDDRVRATVVFGVAIELDEALLRAVGPQALAQALEAMRLQGASLFVDEKPTVVATLEQALDALPAHSFVLCDASEQLRAHMSEESVDEAQALGEFLARPEAGAYKPSFVAVLAGWRALAEESRPRLMNPAAFAHRWCEPVLGLGLFRSRASARALIRRDPQTPELLWRHTHAGDEYVVAGGAVAEPDFAAMF